MDLLLDHEEALFNPNCRTIHLLENIKRRCHCPDNGSLRNDSSRMRKVKLYSLKVTLRGYKGVFEIDFFIQNRSCVLIKSEAQMQSYPFSSMPSPSTNQACSCFFLAFISSFDFSVVFLPRTNHTKSTDFHE